MATHHLLLAIDGTGSSKWRDPEGNNSHVYRFYKDFPGVKEYFDGPGTFGIEMPELVDKGIKWLVDTIQVIRKQYGTPPEHIKINLIGHSRGGSAAISIANKLTSLYVNYAYSNGFNGLNQNILRASGLPSLWKVNFLGLYDAADPFPLISHDWIVQNVNFIAQAQRTNKHITRHTFGVLEVGGGRGKDLFDTSHGGIGGDPGFFSPKEIGNDLYCNALQLVANDIDWKKAASMAVDTIVSPIRRNPVLNAAYSNYYIDKETDEVLLQKITNYWQASVNADRHIRRIAKLAGVPLFRESTHVPWHVREAHLGLKLQGRMEMANLIIN